MSEHMFAETEEKADEVMPPFFYYSCCASLASKNRDEGLTQFRVVVDRLKEHHREFKS